MCTAAVNTEVQNSKGVLHTYIAIYVYDKKLKIQMVRRD